MCAILILMTFAGWKDKQGNGIMNTYAQNKMGLLLIIVVVANLMINMLVIIGRALVKNWRKIYIKYLVWKRNKLRASIELKRSQWEQ
jgi:hypothetical protein